MFGYYGWQRAFGDVLLEYEIKKQKIMSVLQNVIREIGDIVNRLSVSSKEKQKIQEEIQSLVYRYKSELVREQSAAVGEEARGNWLQRSWRPLVMLAFALVILSGMFMESTLLSDSSRLWDLLEIGLGGYVIGRSGERVTDRLLSKKWK